MINFKSVCKIILFSIGTLFLSCKKNESQKEPFVLPPMLVDSVPKTKKRIKLLKLKSKVQTTLNESTSFSVTQNYIDTLNIAPFSEVEHIVGIIREQLEEINNELPSEIKNKSVESRINQIKNYCLKLEFETTKRVLDTNQVSKEISNILQSYNVLVIQLNETQAKLPEEIEKQLKQDNTIKKDTIEGVPLF